MFATTLDGEGGDDKLIDPTGPGLRELVRRLRHAHVQDGDQPQPGAQPSRGRPESLADKATRSPVDVIQVRETVGQRRSSELPTKFRTRAIQSLLDSGPSFTRLREEPLEPGDDRPVFVMPLAAAVRTDLEDVLRELDTAFQIPHCSVQACEGLPAV